MQPPQHETEAKEDLKKQKQKNPPKTYCLEEFP